MNQDEVLDEFRGAGAMLEGHFILTSGLHSSVYFQKNAVFMYPDRTERLCKAMAEASLKAFGKIDVVVSPAVGAIIPGYETAKHIPGARVMFVEREGGKFALRRQFEIKPGERVLLVEDIITTGLSVRETIDAVRQHPGEVVGCACLIDRSGGRAELGVKLISLAQVDVPNYAADQLPPEMAAIPAVKPGSRGLKA